MRLLLTGVAIVRCLARSVLGSTLLLLVWTLLGLGLLLLLAVIAAAVRLLKSVADIGGLVDCEQWYSPGILVDLALLVVVIQIFPTALSSAIALSW